MAKRTITLTGRPPVTIDEDSWPVLASASDKDHDGQVECQANRTSKWFIKVRQHHDGRVIVYGGYDYDSSWRNENNYHARRGVILSPTDGGANDEAICRAIKDVCDDISQAEHAGNDAARWKTLSDDCIADMPAEELT